MEESLRLLFVLVVCNQFLLSVSQLFVTDPGRGYIYQIEPDDDHALKTTYEAGSTVVGITYDDGRVPASNPRRPSLIYSEVTGGIHRWYLDNDRTMLMYNLSVANPTLKGIFADRLDLDPTSGNVYFTTLYYVGVLTPKNVHIELLSGLGGGGRAIAVVPNKGILFYTDHSDKFPHIGKTFMDGSYRKVIVYGADVVWPNGITVDYIDEMIYWTDGFTKTFWRCDYNGDNREALITNSGFQYMDVLLEDNFIYMTEWTNNTLLVYDKTDLSNYTMFTVPKRVRLDSMVMNSEFARLKRKNQVCAQRNGLGDCSDACLPVSTHSYSCGCPSKPYITAAGAGPCTKSDKMTETEDTEEKRKERYTTKGGKDTCKRSKDEVNKKQKEDKEKRRKGEEPANKILKSQSVITLNVGGKEFVVSKTLMEHAGGALKTLSSNAEQRLFIDRSHEYFSLIIEFIRSAYFSEQMPNYLLPNDIKQLKGIIRESKFYGIDVLEREARKKKNMMEEL